MGCDHDRRAETIELDEQPDQPLAHVGVDIARRFVGEQQIGLGDDGARDRHALLFATRQRGRLVVHSLTKADPG